MDVPEEVISYYTGGKELTRLGQGKGLLEAARTKELIARFLPARASVLDVGGGPGYYAQWLASLGNSVHLVDPVTLHVEEARRRAGEPASFTVSLGDARKLEQEDSTFDAVLLLGPLYHLTDRFDRTQALREAARVCRPGGYVLASAISRFAPALDGIREGWIVGDRAFETVRMNLEHGWRYDGGETGWTTAYFHDADDLVQEAQDSGLQVIGVYGIEGPGWLMIDEKKWDDPVMQERLLWLALTCEEDPRMRMVSSHLLLAATA